MTPDTANNKIFCAIDTNDLQAAINIAGDVAARTKAYKLGLEFFNTHGPGGVRQVQESVPNADLFLDLKYHDIPNTVAGAIKAVTSHVTPAYLNVHCSGGVEMMRAARDACPAETKLLGVTILTSLDDAALDDIGYASKSRDAALKLACLAEEAGLDGVVCSAHEIQAIRKSCGPNFELMVPGIRPEGTATNDQKRVMTPRQAIDKGATHLVIGRPITQADDPAAAVKKILQSM
mgnify:CR=1 FL=1